MVNIYFVRHGESENNLVKKMNHDFKNEFHLTKKGVLQAEKVKEELENIKFDRVFTSNFLRTIETAKIIHCEYMSHDVPRCPTNFRIDSRLNEMKIGLEGDDYSFHRDRVNSQILKGKILDDDVSLIKKIEDLKIFLSELKKTNLKNILVVTHKDIIRLIKIIHMDLDIKKFYDFNPKNCEIYKIEL